MGIFPRQKLYRRLRQFAILGTAALVCALVGLAQSQRQSAGKGPRALGLLELAPNGKAHLVPVTIMLDGKFYDASAYKAAPVPMALESGTVYEAVQTGVSLGLFTVTAAGQVQSNWIGEGTWKPAGSEPAKKKAPAAPKPAEEDSDRPVLRRASAEKNGAQAPAPEPTPTPATPPSATAPPPVAAPSPAPAPPSIEETEASNNDQDKDRPILHRGKPAPQPAEKAGASKAGAAKPPILQATPAATKPGSIQMIPAISDAGGPEPRPFTYNLKPGEEQTLRKKMLALAADEVRARDRQPTSVDAGTAQGRAAPTGSKSTPQAKRPVARQNEPAFEDVELRAFDLSNSNEPALVLTVKAHMPQRPGAPAKNIEYFITLVAREEADAELHKAFANITDTLHLDVVPRLELIDAVDVDGDGRGELLFRQTSDAGSAFVVYRVIGEQLWPLFQGTPE